MERWRQGRKSANALEAVDGCGAEAPSSSWTVRRLAAIRAISSNTRRRSAHEQGNVQMGTGRDTGAGTSTDTCASMPETDTGALTTRPLRASRASSPL